MGNNLKKINKNIIALELGTNTMKLVIGDVKKDELVIRKVILNPMPNALYANGEIMDMEGLSANLKHLIKNNKIHEKKCFCCIESGQIITRDVSVPSSNKDTLQDMAKYEVEQFLPIDMENYSVQSVVMKELEIEDKPFAEMLVTAVPKRLIQQVHTLIHKAGLEPVVLDTQANTFAKLIENQRRLNGNDYHRENTVAFIDLGYEKVRISIFQKGKMRFQRLLDFGGKDIDQNISKFASMPLDEAQRSKMSIHNLNYPVNELTDEGKVVNIIKSTLDHWFEEITKVFRYYSSRNAIAGQIEYIYIYGGLSKINGFEDYIQSVFNLPTERIKKVSSVILDQQGQLDLTEILNALGVMYRR